MAAMEMVQEYVKPVREFAKDSMRLVKRCTKPDLKGKTLGPGSDIFVAIKKRACEV